MKNITIFKIAAQPQQVDGLPEFVACAPTQQESIGFVPFAEGLEPVLSVGESTFMRVMIERKKVPGGAIKDWVAVAADKIEQETGRKPGRKLTKELKEQALLALLPDAFPARKSYQVAIIGGMLLVESASASTTDAIVTMLVKAIEGLSAQSLHTNESPAAVMSDWLLTGEPAADFTVDRECELKTPDEMKSVVRYARHPLDIDEVREHVRLGKVPTKLAVTFQSRVSFVLTAGLQLRKIETLAVGESEASAGDAESAWLAEAGLFAAEMTNLMPALIDALGGECEPAEQA